MKRDYLLYLRDIISSMESIQLFIMEMEYEVFRNDESSRVGSKLYLDISS